MRRYQLRPEKEEPKITDIEVDGNTVRFVNVHKSKAHKLTDDKITQLKAMEEQVLYKIEQPEEWEE